MGRWTQRDILEAVQNLAPLAREAGCTLTQFALAWVLREPNVASAIVGASRPEQVAKNVRAAEVELPQDALVAIDAALDGVVISDPARTAEFTPTKRPV